MAKEKELKIKLHEILGIENPLADEKFGPLIRDVVTADVIKTLKKNGAINPIDDVQENSCSVCGQYIDPFLNKPPISDVYAIPALQDEEHGEFRVCHVDLKINIQRVLGLLTNEEESEYEIQGASEQDFVDYLKSIIVARVIINWKTRKLVVVTINKKVTTRDIPEQCPQCGKPVQSASLKKEPSHAGYLILRHYDPRLMQTQYECFAPLYTIRMVFSLWFDIPIIEITC